MITGLIKKFKKIMMLQCLLSSFHLGAMEQPNPQDLPKDNLWQSFIGLDSSLPILKPVTMAVVEGSYDIDMAKEGFDITYISPLVHPKRYNSTTKAFIQRPVQMYDVRLVVNNVQDIQEYIDHNENRAESWLSSKFIANLRSVAADADLVEGDLTSDSWHISSEEMKVTHYGIIFSPTAENQLVITQGDMLAEKPAFIDKAKALIDRIEAEQTQEEKKFIEHSGSILEVLRSTFPGQGLKIKLFHPSELSTIAADPDVDIVSCSSYLISLSDNQASLEASETSGNFYYDYNAFNGSGKIVVIATSNDHHQLLGEDNTGLMKIISNAQGYFPILASTSCSYGESLLGNCGDYFFKGQIDYSYPYMTAPGFFVDFLEDKIYFGCSLAAPFIAAGAARLKAALPDLPLDRVREFLIQAGRKPADHPISSPIISPEQKQKLILEVQSQLDRDTSEENSSLQELINIEIGSVSEPLIDAAYNTALNEIREQHCSREFYSLTIKDPLLRQHVWENFDINKYYNHLDIAAAYALAKEHA
ncbi:hypothetical protein [Candidatus Odyssella thessalonicensis]|uniref:hypothetical protein n=1 Tax=Candidatus Odyssella thessalonicensis TaxID=84647 RepID=UPI000225C095|nr:hypothetical protein [Candidatus Odyssella thessalonicensis]